MISHSPCIPLKANRKRLRLALSLLELTVVVAILSLLSISAISRYGHNAVASGNAEGFARKFALSLIHARRSTIATGDNHFVQVNNSGGSILSYSVIRRASGGDVQIDELRIVPSGISAVASNAQLEFDFEGSALNSYTITISGPSRTWQVTVDSLTGSVKSQEI